MGRFTLHTPRAEVACSALCVASQFFAMKVVVAACAIAACAEQLSAQSQQTSEVSRKEWKILAVLLEH